MVFPTLGLGPGVSTRRRWRWIPITLTPFGGWPSGTGSSPGTRNGAWSSSSGPSGWTPSRRRSTRFVGGSSSTGDGSTRASQIWRPSWPWIRPTRAPPSTSSRLSPWRAGSPRPGSAWTPSSPPSPPPGAPPWRHIWPEQETRRRPGRSYGPRWPEKRRAEAYPPPGSPQVMRPWVRWTWPCTGWNEASPKKGVSTTCETLTGTTWRRYRWPFPPPATGWDGRFKLG